MAARARGRRWSGRWLLACAAGGVILLVGGLAVLQVVGGGAGAGDRLPLAISADDFAGWVYGERRWVWIDVDGGEWGELSGEGGSWVDDRWGERHRSRYWVEWDGAATDEPRASRVVDTEAGASPPLGDWSWAEASPDGRRVAYYSRSAVEIADLETGEVWALPMPAGDVFAHNSGGTTPAWSPDGTRVAFDVVWRGGKRLGLAVTEVEGTDALLVWESEGEPWLSVFGWDERGLLAFTWVHVY